MSVAQGVGGEPFPLAKGNDDREASKLTVDLLDPEPLIAESLARGPNGSGCHQPAPSVCLTALLFKGDPFRVVKDHTLQLQDLMIPAFHTRHEGVMG